METKDKIAVALAIISGRADPLRLDQGAWTEFGFSFDQWHGATAKNQIVGDLSPELALSLWRQRAEEYLAGILVGLIERPTTVAAEKPSRSLPDVLFSIWDVQTRFLLWDLELNKEGILLAITVDNVHQLPPNVLSHLYDKTVIELEKEFDLRLVSPNSIASVDLSKREIGFAWTFRHRS